MDFKIGRMNTIIGYNGFLAPYRPFYSSDYQFFYSQDGAFTGFLTDLHVTNRLDIWNGMTLGANTFFVQRSTRLVLLHRPGQLLADGREEDAVDGLGLLRPERHLRRPEPGRRLTTRSWSCASSKTGARASLRSSSRNMGWDANTPVGTGSWYGLYTIGIFHLNPQARRPRSRGMVRRRQGHANRNRHQLCRGDPGLNWHPIKCLEIRPEIRGDFAGAHAFGVNGAHTDRSQLTGGISFLVKF